MGGGAPKILTNQVLFLAANPQDVVGLVAWDGPSDQQPEFLALKKAALAPQAFSLLPILGLL